MAIQIDREFLNGIERIAPTGALVHCDLSRGLPIRMEKGTKEQVILAHYHSLEALLGGIPLYFPAFSYRFFTERKFDVRHTVAEIGILPEYFRKNLSAWRTRDPAFSFTGNRSDDYSDPAGPGAVIDPFGDVSFFQHLYDKHALLFHYGSYIQHSTVLHFIERKLGIVPYRYDKLFEGTITDGDTHYDITYRFHARPKGMHMAYDWEKITGELTKAGVYRTYKNERTVLSYMSVREMTDFILQKLSADPYYLLDATTSEWVIPAIDRLNRPLLPADFENL
jgi:aminoglycoside N3'-acetyltransferase